VSNITVLLTSDMFLDADDIPMTEVGDFTFYWGAFEDSPGGAERRVWAMFDEPLPYADAEKAVRAALS
jgi:hypothetical protein